MRFRPPHCATLLAAVILAGCGLLNGDGADDARVVCPDLAEPAIVVEVRNAGTDAPEAEGAEGTIAEGGYVDSLALYGYTGSLEPLDLAAGFERPGTYDVRLEKPGFATWRRKGVEVEAGPCGPKTERLVARLVPRG